MLLLFAFLCDFWDPNKAIFSTLVGMEDLTFYGRIAVFFFSTQFKFTLYKRKTTGHVLYNVKSSIVLITCIAVAVVAAFFVCWSPFHSQVGGSSFLVNPLRPSAESCSDWAENFRVALFIYLKNILFNAFIFYLAPLKSYQRFCELNFLIFFTVHWDKSIFHTVFVALAPCP